MKTYLVIIGSTITGLALSALIDLKNSNPAIGNTLIGLIFGTAIIASIVHMEKSK